MVGFSAAASSQMALDSIVWQRVPGGVEIKCYDFQSNEDFHQMWDASVHLDVTVFVKPHTIHRSYRSDMFSAATHVLDITIAAGLDYEVSHMSLSSYNGDIVSSESGLSFTAHEIQLYSSYGAIKGNWSLGANMEIRTGRRVGNVSDDGIDINLLPKRWSYGPQTRGTLLVNSWKGDIDIRMPFSQDSTSLRNMSISIQSETGSIRGTYVTGVETTITTGGHGAINATLLPDFALPEKAYITTSTAAGDTLLCILPPVIDHYYNINPLTNTRSDHSSGSGDLLLTYPSDWEGTALGLSVAGSVAVAGPEFDTIMAGDHVVVARKGAGISSRLDFTTETGSGELMVK